MSWGEAESVQSIAVCYPVSDVLSRGEGDHLPFIDQGEGDVQERRTIRLRAEVWRTVPWR
jgi:hypothetical protein